MKDVEKSFELAARPEEIVEFMLDETFTDRLAEAIDRVSKVELTELEELDDGRVRRVCRFTAPTELPGPLKKFKKKAPENVHWNDIWVVDRQAGRISTQIVADAPDDWHDYYDNNGEISIESVGDARSRLDYRISFNLNAPMGMGMFLNRGVKSAVGDVIDGHGEALRRRFGS